MNNDRDRKLAVAGIAVAVVGLSLGSTMVKATRTSGPTVAFWRLFVGSVIWAAVTAHAGKWPTWEQVRRATPAGLLFGVNLAFFFSGIRITRIAHAEFIGTLAPFIVLPVAATVFGERLKPIIGLLGMVSLSGIALILLSAGGTTNWTGNAMCAGAVSTWAAYLLITRKVRPTLDVRAFMLVMTLTACLTVLPIALVRDGLGVPTTKAWVLIGVMGVTSGVLSHGLYAWAQGKVPVSSMSLLQTSQPALSATWAWWFLDESIRPIQVVGMGIVLASVGGIGWVTASRQR